MRITDYLKDHFLFLDGGMGTMLQKHGLSAGELPERWNITKSDVITGIHRAYYDAGSNVVSTNTFGANILKFSPEELEAIICAAIENARKAAELSAGTQPKWVALDIGPSGKLLAPYGDLEFEDAVALFAQTVKLGVKYGVDFIFIETMNDIYETKAALLAAKENSDLPVFVSNAYGEDGKLMTGASPAAMVAMLEGMGADAIGMNCSLGPALLAPVAEEYLCHASVPVILKPNAGLPQIVDKKTVYTVQPEEFSAEVSVLLEKGVRITGGCCGTTPDHIATTVQAAARISPKEILPNDFTSAASYTHSINLLDIPVTIGDRINPVCNVSCREALAEGDIDYVVSEGSDQQDEEVGCLYVNVSLPGANEAELLPSAVTELQTINNLPLFLAAEDPAALEQAMRLYKGKAIVCLDGGKKDSLVRVFPLVKKYGGIVVALTANENGISEKAGDRLAAAEEILTDALQYGIAKKDIVFAPMALGTGVTDSNPEETLCTIEQIRNVLGCHAVLDVSNVSFAEEAQEMTKIDYMQTAVRNGVSALLINPYSEEFDVYGKTPIPC